MAAHIPEFQKAREFLAAERTFLAWIRTSISLISLGFVVAKFGIWLRELGARLDPRMASTGTGTSFPIGVAMMIFGGILAVLAAWHYYTLSEAIKRGETRTNGAGVAFLAVGVVSVAALTIVYLFVSTKSL